MSSGMMTINQWVVADIENYTRSRAEVEPRDENCSPRDFLHNQSDCPLSQKADGPLIIVYLHPVYNLCISGSYINTSEKCCIQAFSFHTLRCEGVRCRQGLLLINDLFFSFLFPISKIALDDFPQRFEFQCSNWTEPRVHSGVLSWNRYLRITYDGVPRLCIRVHIHGCSYFNAEIVKN